MGRIQSLSLSLMIMTKHFKTKCFACGVALGVLFGSAGTYFVMADQILVARAELMARLSSESINTLRTALKPSDPDENKRTLDDFAPQLRILLVNNTLTYSRGIKALVDRNLDIPRGTTHPNKIVDVLSFVPEFGLLEDPGLNLDSRMSRYQSYLNDEFISARNLVEWLNNFEGQTAK